MTGKYQSYPEYKDSGAEWLGPVPSEWKVYDGKRLFKNRRELSKDTDEQLAASQTYGVVPQSLMMKLNDSKVMLALTGTSSFRHVEKDDFVISLRSFEGGIEHSNYIGCVSPAYTVLSSNKKIAANFYKYLFKSKPFIAALQSSTDSLRDGKSITFDQFGLIPLVLPEIVEQQKIVNFLDHETAKIDKLIERQQQLIKLLKEKRQAVISHAVTKGLNPNAPMRDSGIEWLGEVPEHWEIRRVGWMCEFISYGFTNPMPTTDAGPYMLTATDIDFGRVKYEEARHTSKEAYDILLSPKSKPEEGDILLTKDGTLGRVTVFNGEHETCISQSIALLRLNRKKVIPEFLSIALMGADYQSKMIFDAGGTTIKHIYISILAKMGFILPSLKEQKEIIEDLVIKLGKMDDLIDQAQKASVLLNERRTTLISAAVTGKIDVRSWQAPEANQSN